MNPKLTISFTGLFLLSLVWFMSNFMNVLAAGNPGTGQVIVLALPAEASNSAEILNILIRQQAVATYPHYFPELGVTIGQEQTLLTQLLNSTPVEYAELNYVVTIR